MENFLDHPVNGQLGIFTPMYHREAVQSHGPAHIYSKVLERIERDSAGIYERLEALSPFLEDPAFGEIPDDERSPAEPHWNNSYITGDDPRALVAMLRLLKPNRYMEIGSGISTRFARWAVDRWNMPTKITAIDPVPRETINEVAHELVTASVLDVDLALFEQLEPGDVLFHDGSHVTFNGADTTHLLLEIMPRLKPGVALHFHDIALPYEYPSIFDGRGYNEQYMLASALLFSDYWRVTFPVYYLTHANLLPRGGGSFWLEKR